MLGKSTFTNTSTVSLCLDWITEDCVLSAEDACPTCGYNDGKYHISTVDELTVWADAVNGGNTFSGKTVTLDADINLTGVTWTPVGNFKGTFGQSFYIDLSALEADCTITLDNCTVNGTIITADNYTTLLEAIELPEGRTLADCVVFK